MSGLFIYTCRRVKALGLMALCLLVATTALSGCTEKKEAETKTPTEAAPATALTCEPMNKLPGDVGKKIEADYGNKIKLLSVTTEKQPNGQIKLTSYWQLAGDPGAFNSVFIHFTGADKQILFQGDHPLCQGHPLAELKGKVIKETQTINVPQAAMDKEVEVKMGIYNPTPPNYDRLKIEKVMGVIKDEKDTRAAVGKLNL